MQLTFNDIPDHDGETYKPNLDKERLNTALAKTYRLMRDGNWRTLRAIADWVGCTETSASARLRDFRKTKFQRFYDVGKVKSQRLENGQWIYKLEMPSA